MRQRRLFLAGFIVILMFGVLYAEPLYTGMVVKPHRDFCKNHSMYMDRTFTCYTMDESGNVTEVKETYMVNGIVYWKG